ncbi:MAG TPA: formylmethanofuran dehydrogenase subunit C [Gemmatirosa sp.]
MSDVVTLTLRTAPDGPLDLDGAVTPDRLALLGEREIAALAMWDGARAARLGDFFTVEGERAGRVRVVGATAALDGLGAGMAGGELLVDGDAGQRAGAGMTGGALRVTGNVGDDAGAAMSGGSLHVDGRAGDRLGAATPGATRGMTGGEIVVRGSAGDEAGARARRGLIVVGGDVGARGARAMIAGSLVVLGRAGASTGVGSKRGSVIAVGGADVPATYRYACTFEPPHVRLTMTYLRRRYALSVDDGAVAGRYRRYCGDAGTLGKGEILTLVRG